jgi:hypothetical protein
MNTQSFRLHLLICLVACFTTISEGLAQNKSNGLIGRRKSKKSSEVKIPRMSKDSLSWYVREIYSAARKENLNTKGKEQILSRWEDDKQKLNSTINERDSEKNKDLILKLEQLEKQIVNLNKIIDDEKRKLESEFAQRTKSDWNVLINATLKTAVMVPMDIVQAMIAKGSSEYLFQLTEFGNQSELLSRVTNFMDNGIGSPATFSEDFKQLKRGFNQEFVGQANYYKSLMTRLKHFEAASKDLDGILSDIRGNKELKVRQSFLDLYTYSSALDAYPYLKKKYDSNYTKDDPLGLTF